jgi:hypothetical protein
MTELDFALKDTEFSFRTLEFAVRMDAYCENGFLELDKFLGGQSDIFSDFPALLLNSKDINVISKINIGIAFSATAITLDVAFETTGTKRQFAQDTDFQKLWLVTRNVRNAFAHGVANPKWEINDNNHRKLISTGCNVQPIDFSNLHGKEFEYDHIGGIKNWYSIKNAAICLIKKIPNKA